MSKNQRKDTYYFTRPNPLQLTPCRYNCYQGGFRNAQQSDCCTDKHCAVGGAARTIPPM
jgi:hypothetical protein